jgi:hypothetical protein
MEKIFNIPPKNPQNVISTKDLAICLKSLIGKSVKMTGKPRTDGSTIRKIVMKCLSAYHTCETAKAVEYEIIPHRRKGLPRLLLELVDTYIVTSGTYYNLQIWNRFPNSKSALIEYKDGKKIRSNDIRLVFLKINLQKSIIESIAILTPEYIEKKFGQFGNPTIKHQIIISEKKRTEIKNSVLLGTDTKRMSDICRKTYKQPKEKMTDFPKETKPFCIELLSKLVAEKLLKTKLQSADTKNRGQILERKTMTLLGYQSNLVGGYPDIPNQLLEVKVQDSATIDLGKYSPEFEEVVYLNITTKDIRYLIVLTNPKTNIIESVVLVSGKELGDIFSFVSDTSFKCQRSIPMSFFEKHRNKCVFNP